MQRGECERQYKDEWDKKMIDVVLKGEEGIEEGRTRALVQDANLKFPSEVTIELRPGLFGSIPFYEELPRTYQEFQVRSSKINMIKYNNIII